MMSLTIALTIALVLFMTAFFYSIAKVGEE